jgi:fermentation-respiration switch protein FrsA (DUF1100 family)
MPVLYKEMFVFIKLILILFAGFTVISIIFYCCQSLLLYQPGRRVFSTPADIGLSYEEVCLTTPDGLRLNAWFTPADNAVFTVLYCHGNGGNLAYYLDVVQFLHTLNLSCLAFDYRGYGKSDGKPSEQGTFLDAQTAYYWLINEKNIPPEKIIIYGWSLGASVAALLSSKTDSAALVLDSAFTSYVDIAKRFFPFLPVKTFAKFRYDTIDYVKEVHIPVMIIHSRNDETTPFKFGKRLFDAANEPKKFVEIYGRHNNAFQSSADIYKESWQEWLTMFSGKLRS